MQEYEGEMIKLVWDTSAIINIKENGYSPGYSLYTDFSEGIIEGPYINIFPTVAVFEVNAVVSKKHRKGINILREFYILNDNSIMYDIDVNFVSKCKDIVASPGFDKLNGADLIFACIAYLEKAYLVTLDKHFMVVSSKINLINLSESLDSPNYRKLFV